MGIDKIEKLRGRDNYDTWKFAAKSYLVIKGYWPCIVGSESDATKNLHAISAIGLLLEPHNYTYVQPCTSAQEAWKSLETAFEDNGVLRKMDLLKYFIRLELNDCASMEDYVNRMTTAHQKLEKSGTKLPDEVCAQIMLSGLPEQYRPMVLALANCGKTLTTDLVRTNLLQEIRCEPNEMALLTTNKKQQKNYKKSVICFECKKPGHYANKCPTRRNKNNLLFANACVAKTQNS